MSERLSSAPGILCECRAWNFGGLAALNAFLAGEPVFCRAKSCSRQLDYREDARRAFPNSPLALLGGIYKHASSGGEWRWGDRYIVDRDEASDLGSDARIMTFSWESHENWLVLGHSNLPSAVPPEEITLICVARDGTKRLEYHTSWVPWDSRNEISWAQLVAAFSAHRNRDYSAMCFAANVAVESALARALPVYLGRHFRAHKTRDFLSRVDYSERLRYLMPMLGELVGAPLLPKWIMADLWKLLECRNEVGHYGALRDGLDDDTAMNLLIASALSFYYVRLLQLYFSGAAPACFAQTQPASVLSPKF